MHDTSTIVVDDVRNDERDDVYYSFSVETHRRSSASIAAVDSSMTSVFRVVLHRRYATVVACAYMLIANKIDAHWFLMSSFVLTEKIRSRSRVEQRQKCKFHF